MLADVAAIGLLTIGVATLSGRLHRLPLSEPVLVLLAGVLLARRRPIDEALHAVAGVSYVHGASP
ncbi:MAG: hypothetical protein M3143_02250 [Actinomycetota bacterium]|nr:hypothetical protein [Actinomycetota bacterium]